MPSDIFHFNKSIWVFIPIYNFELFINICLLSLKTQKFINYNVLIIDDGSTDSSSEIIDKWVPELIGEQKQRVVTVIRNSSNMGPAYTKWQAIEYVRRCANINDIFTILDGDDSYKNDTSLLTLFYTYIKKGTCLFTYGSALGEYTDQAAALTTLDGLRRPGSVFKFQHPRSCLVYLLRFFVEQDFQYKDGSWLLRITDWQFIFKCIELSGLARVAYIKTVLYNYRSHPNNVRNKIDNTYKERVTKYIAELSPSSPVEEEIHIVLCCYRRHHNIGSIIDSIEKQTVSGRINIHIINTNPSKWSALLDMGLNSRVGRCKIRLCNTQENLFGYARFLYVKRLMKDVYLPYVIFIDDDQWLPPDWVERMYAERAPLTYSCWYGRIFETAGGISDISYWNDKILQHKRLLAEYGDEYIGFHYGATCGCIIDTVFFDLDILYKCPKKYRNVEDLWLSFVVKHIIGGSIKIVKNPINPFHFSDTEDTALWTGIMNEKEDFLKMLCRVGYCFSDSINITELESIMEKDDDSELSIGRFTFVEG